MKRILVFILFLMFSINTMAATKVLLMVIPGCDYCAEAKILLNSKRVPYKTSLSKDGPVPRLYVNGKLQGLGLNQIKTWVDAQPGH